MGDIANYINETEFDIACDEQDILDSGDMLDAYERGLVDELGFVDMSNPPGLIGFMRPIKNVGRICRCCGKKGLKWGNVDGKWRLFDGNRLHHCPVNPLVNHRR